MTLAASMPGQPSGADNRLIGISGVPDRREWFLYRADRAGRIVQLKEAAFEFDHLLGPQPLDQLERLQHARHPFLPGHAERLVFDFAIADADTEHDAAFRHYIEARDVLSD